MIKQHGITGMVAVFHWQTERPVEPALGQQQGPAWPSVPPRPGDTEPQPRRLTRCPCPGPRWEQASFAVINEGDGARTDEGLLEVVVRGVVVECV